MKRLILVFIILFSLIYANPKAMKYGFSEVQIVNENEWFVELYNWNNSLGSSDSLFLECENGKSKIVTIDSMDIVVFYQDDLELALQLNRENDYLKLYSNHSMIDSLKIGTYEGSYIHHLDSTQSVACGMNWGDEYSKCETPTPGEENTGLSTGKIYGHFYDKDGSLITDRYVKIREGDFLTPASDYIDSTGFYTTLLPARYHFYNYLIIWRPYIDSDGWNFNNVMFDLEPGDSLEVDFYASQTSVRPVIKNDIIKFNNYPHPASSYTWFVIDNTEIEASAMRVNVYALNGRKVDSFKPRAYQYRYDCSHLPQGSYIMSLQHGSEVLATKKLQILK